MKRRILLAYLHIPYCDSKCHYCAFNSYVGRFDTRPQYMEALHRQLTDDLERLGATPESVETLFIGGGTPSTVSPKLYEPIFECLAPFLAPEAEITVEANPNSATRDWLSGMHTLGVNRVSFGVQSFDADKLRRLGRAHTPQQAITALETAYEAGVKHLSLDLIYNVYGDTPELLERDIGQAFTLPIDHLSAYELTIEANTPFAATPDVRQTDDALAFFVAEAITARGFEHYEISNFGRYRSRHNLGYWELRPYLGIGAGAVGFDGTTRTYPPTDIDTYLADPLQRRVEPLTSDDLRTERIFLGLRSRLGIKAKQLNEGQRERADVLVREGKLYEEAGRYLNPNFFLADEIALFLIG